MGKPLTMRDLARELGVSISTVSKALNGSTDISTEKRKEIIDYARKVNYVPNEVARSFRIKKTMLIGIIVTDNSNPFYAQVIKGIEEIASQAGFSCIIMNNHESVEQELQFIGVLKSLNVAGVILAPASGNTESSELLEQAGIPYVLVSRYIEEEQNAYVVLDDFQAAYLATKHLCEYEHDKIFYLNYKKSISSVQERLEGYKKALSENGIPYDPDCVKYDCINLADGYHNMREILETHKPPFSVLCYSDYVAIGALCAIQEQGYSLPYDIALCGNDDIELFSYVRPRITTVCVPKYSMGVKCAELLIKLIREKDNPQDGGGEPLRSYQITMLPELLLRTTS